MTDPDAREIKIRCDEVIGRLKARGAGDVFDVAEEYGIDPARCRLAAMTARVGLLPSVNEIPAAWLEAGPTESLFRIAEAEWATGFLVGQVVVGRDPRDDPPRALLELWPCPVLPTLCRIAEGIIRARVMDPIRLPAGGELLAEVSDTIKSGSIREMRAVMLAHGLVHGLSSDCHPPLPADDLLVTAAEVWAAIDLADTWIDNTERLAEHREELIEFFKWEALEDAEPDEEFQELVATRMAFAHEIGRAVFKVVGHIRGEELADRIRPDGGATTSVACMFDDTARVALADHWMTDIYRATAAEGIKIQPDPKARDYSVSLYEIGVAYAVMQAADDALA